MKFLLTLLAGGGLSLAVAPLSQADDAAVDGASSLVVQGIVVDPRDRPVVGASIEVVVRAHRWVAGKTNSQGEFRILLEDDATQFVHLVARDSEARLAGTSQFLVEPSLDPARIAIHLRPVRRIRVGVADRQGRPVPDALTEVVSSGFPSAAARTDAHGVSLLTLPADAELQSILALKPGLGFDYVENRPAAGRPRPIQPGGEIHLTLGGARPFRLVAVGEDGKPIPGLMWVPRGAGRSGFNKGSHDFHNSQIAGAVTDESGVAAFNWISPDCREMLTFDMLTPGFQTETSTRVDSGKLPSELGVVCRRPNQLSISGVVLQADGRPAAGIRVHADVQPGAFNRRGAITRTNGCYTIIVKTPGTYTVSVIDKELTAKTHENVPVLAGRSANGVDFRLIKGTLLRGKLFLADPSSNDFPFIIRLVALVPDTDTSTPPRWLAPKLRYRGTVIRSAQIKPGSEYRFRVGPGRYELELGGQEHIFTVRDEPQRVCHFTR